MDKEHNKCLLMPNPLSVMPLVTNSGPLDYAVRFNCDCGRSVLYTLSEIEKIHGKDLVKYYKEFLKLDE